MTFEQLFNIFYTLYRGEDTPPTVGDPEWDIAIQLYNNAINRMAAFDDTKWNFMWKTLQTADDGVKTLATATTTYEAPSDMAEPGGQLTYIDTNSNRNNYPVVQPYEAQAMSTSSIYGYFTGDRQAGFILHTTTPTTTQVGYGIDYVYYRKPIEMASDEDGLTLIEGGDPAFYYNHMLANRWRPDENYSGYQTALRDAEEALKGMKLKNNSGSFYNAWGIQDTSGTGWGN